MTRLALFALLVVAACTDRAASSSRPNGDDSAAGAAGVADSGAGARDNRGGESSRGPSDLRVEFEELALDSEPTFITDFAFYPGSSSEFLALDKSGKLLHFELGENKATLLSKAQVDSVYDRLDCGAISLAFEPDLAAAPYVYVGSCVSVTHSAIVRLELDAGGDVVPESQVTVLRVGSNKATRPWHNIGSIGFEPSGVLWALFGEKVQAAPAQELSSPLGKLLRIVPKREPGVGGYEPAADGPLASDAEAEPALYALGLRSPFRGTLDSRGFFWIGDVGSDFFEEIDVAREPRQNFGWPDFEGPCAGCGDSTAPAFAWQHGTRADYIADDPEVETTVGRVAWVGPEVLPHEPDRYGGLLAGSVLFGDYCAGFLRQGRVDADGMPTLDAPLGHLNNAAAFRQHSDGFVYAITFGRCQTDAENAADEGQSRLYRMLPVD